MESAYFFLPSLMQLLDKITYVTCDKSFWTITNRKEGQNGHGKTLPDNGFSIISYLNQDIWRVEMGTAGSDARAKGMNWAV